MSRKLPSISEKMGELAIDESPDNEIFRVPETSSLRFVNPGRLEPNPSQPRKTFSEESIIELSESIRERGILNPITVRESDNGRFQIIAGERRWRAAQLAGMKEVPVIIKPSTDTEAKIISLIENLQREDLNDIERAGALKELKTVLGVTWEEMGQRVGLSKRSILRLVGLLDLPEPVQERIASGTLTEKHGRALRQLGNEKDKQSELLGVIEQEGLSGDETIQLVKKVKGDPRVTFQDALARTKEETETSKPVKAEQLALLPELRKVERELRSLAIDMIDLESRRKLRTRLNKIISTARNLLVKIENTLPPKD